MSVPCPHSHCRTSGPEAAYGRIPVGSLHLPRRGTAFMSEERDDQERPCLHCMMVDLIDDFFAEYPARPAGSDKVDTGEADEVIVAIAKTVAELTCQRGRHDPAAIDRTVDAGNHELRCRVSSRRRCGCDRVSCTALTAKGLTRIGTSKKRLRPCLHPGGTPARRVWS